MTSNSQSFALPTPENWKHLVDDLKLNPIQANELGILLRHAEVDVEAFCDIHPDRADRQELVDALKAFAKALGKLEDVVTVNLPKMVSKVLTPNNRKRFWNSSRPLATKPAMR